MSRFIRLNFSADINRYTLSFPFDRQWYQKAQSISKGRFDRENKVWIFSSDAETIRSLLQVFQNEPIRLNLKDLPKSAPILEDLFHAMRERNYSQQTYRTYRNWIFSLCCHYEKLPSQITSEEIHQYIKDSQINKNLSSASVRSMRQAFLFYFITIRSQLHDLSFPRMKKELHLPEVLSDQETKKLFASILNHKHKVLLKLAYSAGLRVSEAVHLKLSDIDFERKTVRVKSGKGKKDRYSILADSLCIELKSYLEERFKSLKFSDRYGKDQKAENNPWLFPGTEGNPLAVRSAEKIFEASKKRAGIRKKVSFHSLRHAFATHLLEQGTDIRVIQTLLGHSSIRTTQIYAKVSKAQFQKIKSPLDQL